MALEITGKLIDPRPPFRAVPSALPLGTALADVSMGWDGTVWGIDELGVPYRFDPLAETWHIHGRGYDALTFDEKGAFLVIRDGLVLEAHGTDPPQPLARRWPKAATAFQHALDGAGRAGGVVYLFGSGRYAVASGDHEADPPQPLNSLAGWPDGRDWSIFADGVIDAVGSNLSDAEDPHLLLFRHGWYVVADMPKRQVVGGPWPVSGLFESLPTPTPMPAALEAGFDAVLYWKQNRTDIKSVTGMEVYQGLVLWSFGHQGAATAYAEFYDGWSPKLAEAPSGRAGDLWSTAKDGTPRHHDGTDWGDGPSHEGTLRSISVGADGAVFAVGGDNTLLRLSPDRTAWTRLATVPADAAQVAAGDAGRVWVRGQQGGVLQYGAAGGSLAPVPLGAPATHIAGNHDGTLWHCRADGAAVHRFISESEGIDTGQRSQALPVAPEVSSVISVASLGFGTAYVLATARSKTGLGEGSPQLYAYDSPYVFKTSASYNYGYNIATGGGQVYFQVWEPDSQYIVALDAHTGEERWRTPASEPQRVIYDANYQFVYVATVGQGSTLYALDARTGAPAWTTDADELGLSAMSMSLGGNALCVADVEAKLWVFDTALARRDGPRGRHPIPIWEVELWPGNPDTFAWLPLIEGRTAYVAAFVQPGEKDTGIRTLVMACVDLAPGTVRWTRHVENVDLRAWDGPSLSVLRANIAFSGPPEPALVLNAFDRIIAFRLADDGVTQKSYPAPGNVRFTTDIAASDGLLYVGSMDGSLYTLDAGLRPVEGAPMQLSPGRQVLASPVVGRDDQGLATVITSTQGDECLWLAQPSTRNLIALSTNLTHPTNSAFDAAQGVLYTAGVVSDRSLAQVFAIRVSAAVQALRDFIVESELLQDYEQQPSSSPGQTAPPAPVARYQTHVTVVNDVKAPQPHQTLKLWADRTTDVRIDGTPYILGPTAPATLQTDGTGSLTIVSDAADMFATPLRLWAAFMDPYERVVIYPDREFHGRLSTTNASGAGDPRTIDLATAAPYADATKPLFDADQAHAVAGAVQQAMKGVGMGGTVPPTGPGEPAPDALAGVGVAAPPARYVALPDLTGLSYFPADTPSTRTAAIATPIGMALSSDGIFTAMPAAEAAAAIDGLGAGLGAPVGSIFDDFRQLWTSVKAGEAKVARVVISVANEVYLGIEYELNKAGQVFRQVVRDLEDVAGAIGSFFVMLGKKLAEVLEALSQLLHLEQVFATAGLIQEIFAAFFDPANPHGLHAILTRAKEGSETFFPTALGKVDDYLRQVVNTLEPGTAASPSAARLSAANAGMGRLRGMGATPHTVLAAAPKDDDSHRPPSSQAVQGMWGLHQARQHAQAATPGNQLARADNPFAGLVEDFVTRQRLNDPNSPLGKALADARRQFSTSFTVQSPDDFFRLGLADLLEIVKVIVTASLELVQALIDTLLESIDVIVRALQNLGQLSIPILSPLWEAKFGKPLTFLDLLAFVAAIPVTLLYRIIEGRYPAQDRLLEGTDARLVLNRVAGLTSAAAGIAGGVFTALIDTAYVLSGGVITGALSLPQKITGGVLMGAEAMLTFYEGSTSQSAALASAATFITIGVEEAADDIPEIAAFFNCVLSMWLIVMYVYAFEDPRNEQTPEELASNVLASIPGLVGPTKFAPPATPVPYIAPAADLGCWLAAAGLTVATTVEAWDE